jgi:short-subunit dehydrogenase involved in D-alanine esterification of teichoic acids
MGINMEKTRGDTVLIPGGATGTGLALAESSVTNANRAIVCGGMLDKLK